MKLSPGMFLLCAPLLMSLSHLLCPSPLVLSGSTSLFRFTSFPFDDNPLQPLYAAYVLPAL